MSAHNIRVLIVEDDEDSALLLSLQLNDACPETCLFSIDCARSVSEALGRLAATRYDIILLDLGLPDSRGLESVERVRAATETPIVVLTGQSDRGLGAEAVSRGAQDFLCKDRADIATLRRSISFAIERSKGGVPAAAPIEPDWSALAHELRSPVSIVLAAIANLRDGLAGPLTADQLELVKLAERSAARIGRALENVLGLARMRSGRAPVKLEELDVAALLRRCVEDTRAVARRRGLKVELGLPAALPAVRGEPELAEQAARNLLDNALRHAATSVTVTAERRGAEVIIRVEDDGAGVPLEKLPRLFGRFAQLERVPGGDGYRGTGLGLALCREAAGLQGGRVWAEPGPGGKFRLALPCAVAAADRR